MTNTAGIPGDRIWMMGGDFDDVETQFGDFLNVSQAVGAPFCSQYE